jgi:DNA-binding transcriptional LysR family regulator
MRPTIDAEHLDAFVTFAEHMNFTRAARARRISQPALHTQVKKLSEALGATLYTRRGQRLALTPDGERVLGFGRDARERVRSFVAELSHRDVDGPIVLCSGEGAYLYLLGEGLRRFTTEHGCPHPPAPRRAPRASGAGAAPKSLRGSVAQGAAPATPELRLLVRDHEGTVHAVRTGEAHLGVASLETPPDGLRADLLTEVGQVVLLPASHPLAEKRAVRLRDLAGERLVVPPEGRPHRTLIAQSLRAAGVRWRVGVEASGWELLTRFAELGFGLAIVNAFCRIPDGLVARPMPELPSRAYYLLQRRDAAREGAVASLAAALRATAGARRKRA